MKWTSILTQWLSRVRLNFFSPLLAMHGMCIHWSAICHKQLQRHTQTHKQLATGHTNISKWKIAHCCNLLKKIRWYVSGVKENACYPLSKKACRSLFLSLPKISVDIFSCAGYLASRVKLEKCSLKRAIELDCFPVPHQGPKLEPTHVKFQLLSFKTRR